MGPTCSWSAPRIMSTARRAACTPRRPGSPPSSPPARVCRSNASMSASPRSRRARNSRRSVPPVRAGGGWRAPTSTAPRPRYCLGAGCRGNGMRAAMGRAAPRARSELRTDMLEQRRSDGSLRHLITLADLSRAEIQSLLDHSARYVSDAGARPPSNRSLNGITIANMFTEPSTRTRVSFELAGRRLGADVLNIEVQLSSRAKGESMLDTIRTLEAMHIDVLVIRDSEPGVIEEVARDVAPHVSVLSGGEAHVSHPTQGLLDALTIRQRKGADFSRLTVALVGDIRHSRVARSAYEVLTALGVGQLRLIGPAEMMPPPEEFPGCRRFHAPEDGLAQADVVMMLRIQKERMLEASIPDGAEYFARFGLTAPRLKLAKADAIVMHPGPMNRGIEISSEVADGPQSVIRAQVRNGVAVRMAVLETVARPRRLAV